MLVRSCFTSDDIADAVATCTWYLLWYFCSGGSSPARLLSKDEDRSLQGSTFSSSYIPPPGTAQSHLFTDLFERRTEMLLQHVLPFGGT